MTVPLYGLGPKPIQDEIISMAREAGCSASMDNKSFQFWDFALERFAALVATRKADHSGDITNLVKAAVLAEREKLIAETPYLGEQLQAYVLAEREQCAKLCDELAELNRRECTDSVWQWSECAAAIRARG